MREQLRRRMTELRNRQRFRRHDAVGRALYERYGLVVRNGPFAGLRLADGAARRPRALGPRLLGTYEDVLRPFVEAAAADAFGRVVNVGAADGYFAVGLARRMAAARVIAYEMDGAMRELLEEAARRNGVAGRLEIRGLCTAAALAEDVRDGAFLFVDCEGAELELLDPVAVPGLSACAAIVELHDFLDPSISATLLERFEATHETAVVTDRSEGSADLAELRELSPQERRLATDELRPARMSWLVMAPRGGSGPFTQAIQAQR